MYIKLTGLSFNAKMLISLLLSIAFFAGGCGCGCEKVSLSRQLKVEMSSNSRLEADSSFGFIDVTGTEDQFCDVNADITVCAPTKEEAQQIADQVELRLDTTPEGLKLYVHKPKLGNNRSVQAQYKVAVPTSTSFRGNTSFGEIKVKNLQGDVTANTSFAGIHAEDVSDALNLRTSYGQISCRKVTPSEIRANTSFGGIDISCTSQTPADLNVNADTSYGNIDFELPSEFVGVLEAKTSFGSINSKLTTTALETSKDRIKATIAQGNGRIDLSTSFGSIDIR